MNSNKNKQADQSPLPIPENKQEILSVENIIAIMVSQDIHLDVQQSSKIITRFFETTDGILKKGYRVNIPLFGISGGAVKDRHTPVLEMHIDVNTGSVDNSITLGGVIIIKGRHLVFDPNNAKQGIFYIAENKQEYRVNSIGRITWNELLFFAPDNLPAGQYHIEVRTIAEAGAVLICGSLNATLTITDKHKNAGLK